MNVVAIDLICMLLFIGAMGKSAQIFYTLGCQMQWKDPHLFQP